MAADDFVAFRYHFDLFSTRAWPRTDKGHPVVLPSSIFPYRCSLPCPFSCLLALCHRPRYPQTRLGKVYKFVVTDNKYLSGDRLAEH